MWKILIADDEPRICRGIKELIESFDTLDLEVCGVASNGMMALEMAVELEPDILLADICMPKLNGIDMIKKLRENAYGTDVVIITGHDEFEFAKEAIGLGVTDYLLKPIEDESLYGAIKKIISKRTKETRNEKYQSMLKNQLRKNQQYLQKEFFREWLENGMLNSSEEFIEQMNMLSIEFPENAYVIVARDDNFSLKKEDAVGSHVISKMEIAMGNVLDKYNDENYVFSDSHQNIIGILKIDEKINDVIKKECQVKLSELVMNDCSIAGCECVFNDFPEKTKGIIKTLSSEKNFSVLVKRAVLFIQDNYKDNTLDLVMVSEKVGCNPAYLSRLMKQEIGVSFKDFLSDLRIQKAIEMIKGDLYSINQIAEEVGYSSQHYFSTVFKNIVGMSPTECRKQVKMKGMS